MTAMETPAVADCLNVACSAATKITFFVSLLDSFWACTTPTDAPAMIKAATPDATSDFFIWFPPCVFQPGFPFWPPAWAPLYTMVRRVLQKIPVHPSISGLGFVVSKGREAVRCASQRPEKPSLKLRGDCHERTLSPLQLILQRGIAPALRSSLPQKSPSVRDLKFLGGFVFCCL